MNIKEIKKEALLARICATRQIMGEDAAQAAAESINQLLKEKEEINILFAKALDLVGDGHYVFGVNNKFYDAAMLVLKEAVNDKYDYISWWLYEGEPDYKVWSSDNTEEWNLTEPEALYDFIVNECQE